MKLLLDEMHAAVAAAELRAGGFDVVAVAERADLRGRSDHDILQAAVDEGRAVITENVRDFVPLTAAWAAEGRTHLGLVLTSPRRINRAHLAYPGDLISALTELLGDPPVTGESWTWWL